MGFENGLSINGVRLFGDGEILLIADENEVRAECYESFRVIPNLQEGFDPRCRSWYDRTY